MLLCWCRRGVLLVGCYPTNHAACCGVLPSKLWPWPCRRRDLEAARTLADQVRKREKLKRRELQLYKEEWAARMQGELAAAWAGQVGSAVLPIVAACLLLLTLMRLKPGLTLSRLQPVPSLQPSAMAHSALCSSLGV